MLGADGGGFGLWTDAVLGVKDKDLAIIYTFIISIYLISKGEYKLPKFKFFKLYKLFCLFLICSVLFSYTYYEFSFYQILQGGRDFLSYFHCPF